jgi:RNA polymerase sigma-70 factor, ECF subfamily
MKVVDVFMSAVDPCVRERLSGAEVETLLSARLKSARRWPNVNVPDKVFVTYLAQRIPPAADGIAVLESMHVDELLLACACSRLHPEAIKVLQQEYFPVALSSLARMRLRRDQLDEVNQGLVEQLLLPREGCRPTILTYAGLGLLSSWLSVCAARLAGRLVRQEEKRPQGDQELLSQVPSDHDPETQYWRQSCRQLVSQSLKEALATLEPRERDVLHQHYLEGLTIAQAGHLHGVHRATAACWLSNARRKLRERTYESLQQRLHGRAADVALVIKAAVDNGTAGVADNVPDLTRSIELIEQQ